MEIIKMIVVIEFRKYLQETNIFKVTIWMHGTFDLNETF